MQGTVGRFGEARAFVALVATSLLVVISASGCGGSDENEDTEGDPSGDGDGDDGDVPEGSGGTESAEGSGGTTVGDGDSGDGDSSAASCGNQLTGEPCSDAESCSWSDTEHCLEGECFCPSGTFVCSSQTSTNCNSEGATCPQAIDTQCGDPCEGMIFNCLCRSGGGPDYTNCSCSGSTWDCGD
jgi:hypothetical protein